ncbi:hypothetical protein, partial [Bacillus toyonensis]|uniref:hypothetical protein n=1 Tax=Bacillus toyonensis TaxID=155322 RepID=UPI00339709BA
IKLYNYNDSTENLINEIDSDLNKWFSKSIVDSKFNQKINDEKFLEEVENYDLRYRLKISSSNDFSFGYVHWTF